MRASSQASLEAAADRWEPVLTAASGDALNLARELFGVVDVLDDSAALRRALTDPGRDAGDKAQVASDLFGGKVSEAVVDLLAGMARGRWSAERDIADALARLAIDTVLASAAATDCLEQVEEEVFRIGRLLADHRDLRLMLADSTVDLQRRQDLAVEVFGASVTEQTAVLLRRSVGNVRHGSLAAALGEISDLAAERRRRLVAVVTAAVPLTTEQTDRLRNTLTRAYGRTVQVHVGVDPQVLGGMRIEIGDDVVDGTTIGRLDDARRRLAG